MTFTSPTNPVADTPDNAMLTVVEPKSANGAPENGYAENIYSTTHLDPLGTVTAAPLPTVIGPTATALEPTGIE